MKANFLVKKLGLPDDESLDEGIAAVGAKLKGVSRKEPSSSTTCSPSTSASWTHSSKHHVLAWRNATQVHTTRSANRSGR